MENNEKYCEYAAKILSQIQEMFDDECENHIDISELQEGDNLKHFFHALASVAPGMIFNKFTNDDKNHLEFNHVANLLCFEFGKMPEENS